MTTPKVLLVDDVKVFLEFERGFFDRAGCTILTATSGLEALRLARDEKPHIVLLDYEMPGMKGDEVCRRIREDAATRHIPVLIVTSHPTPDVSNRCRRAGCTDFVAKPINGRDLLQRVVNILQMPYRIDMRTRVSMEVSLDRPGETVAVLGYSVDISEGGILVEANDPVAEGSEVKISFKLPDEVEPLVTRVRVVRVARIGARSGYSVALNFAGPPARFLEAIRAFVERELGR